jgi:hypothetical protein
VQLRNEQEITDDIIVAMMSSYRCQVDVGAM